MSYERKNEDVAGEVLSLWCGPMKVRKQIKKGGEFMKIVRIIVILVLVFVLGAIIIQNRAPVKTHFLFVTIEMPHILLLLLTAAGGFALGLFVTLFKAFKLKE